MTSIPPGGAPPRDSGVPLLRAIQGVDFKRLPLTPAEGNVLMRVMGGASNPAQAASEAGIQLDTAQRAVERLIELKAIEWFDPAKAAQQEEAAAAGRFALGGLGLLAAAKLAPPTPGLYDVRELEVKADMEPEKRRHILEAFYRLDTLDYYELLGLHRLVDRKQVKSAYYAVAPDFHPDKFFQRDIGPFRARIEAIFARLTLAHDVLSNKQKRGEYDEYLDMLDRNRAAVASAQQLESAVAQARSAAEQAAQAAVSGAGASPTPDGGAAQALADRKRALAMKLMGGNRPGGASAPPPRAQAAQDARGAAEALRNRFEHAKHEATRRQVAHYIASGRDSLTRGDFAAAANAYRIASSLAPDDPNLQRDAADVIQQANRALAESFMKQGEYEVSQERFSEAAISFGKAATGRPDDPRPFDRAAYATYRAGSNPRRAVEYARHAVELRPSHFPYHVTLAHCFLSAGAIASAEAEIARVIELAGKDERAKTQLEGLNEHLRLARQDAAG